MNVDSTIYIAGHNGMVGSSLLRYLKRENYKNLICKDSSELDLRSKEGVDIFFKKYKPEYIFLSAAKVGGIIANMSYPAQFIYDNITIATNVIHSSYKYKSKKLLFLGSSCIYPKITPQPIKEDYLLSGKLESTNEAYAIAKISGLKMCQYYRQQYKCNFISAMPCNLYGINDNFNLETAHVLSSLIRKTYEAKVKNKKEVVIYGTGKPKREFLFVDDLAEALVFLMKNYENIEPINVGSGKDLEIIELANIIKNIIGFKGNITNDISKPDGTMNKLLDVTKINKLGWHHKTNLEDGIKKTFEWYLKNKN